MALLGGLNAVYELPAYYACSSAEEFAAAAVITMKCLSVTHLAFGAECEDLALLKKLAAVTISENEAFTDCLKEQVAAGETYASAYSHAICQCVTEPGVTHILSQPNNMLALCYLRAILRHCPDMEPVLIPRKKAMYHDTRIQGNIASAAAIRNHLTKQGISSEIMNTIPASTSIHMPQRHAKLQYLSNHDLSQLLTYSLLTCTQPLNSAIPVLGSSHVQKISDIYDISSELANRMTGHTPAFADFDTLVDMLKTKQYTRTRISRSLIHLLLSMRQDTFSKAKEKGYIFYVRLLGFTKTCSPLIRYQKLHCPVPFIQKVSQAENTFAESDLNTSDCIELARQLFSTDLYASNLYRLCWYHKYEEILPDDYQMNACILNEE